MSITFLHNLPKLSCPHDHILQHQISGSLITRCCIDDTKITDEHAKDAFVYVLYHVQTVTACNDTEI